MRHSSEFDLFEQYIRDRVGEFSDEPSEGVWDGLEARWDRSAGNHSFNGFRGAFFWMMVGFTTLFGTAIWGLNSLYELQSELPDLSMMMGMYEVKLVPQEECEPMVYKASHLINQRIPKQISMTQTTRASTQPLVSSAPSSSVKTYSPQVDPLTSTESQIEPILLSIEEKKDRNDLPKRDLQIKTEPARDRSNTKEEKRQKKKRSKAKAKFGSQDWWSSPRSWKNGKSWDYQIGIQAMTERYLSTFARDMNPFSSNYQIDLLGEWVPNHRIRLATGISLGGRKLDFGSRLYLSPMSDLVDILNTYHGASIDSLEVRDITTQETTANIAIPAQVLFFFTSPDLETQLYGGAAFRFNISSRYNYQYGVHRINNPEVEWIITDQSFHRKLFVEYRLLLGLEQRLSKAFRLRVQGHLKLGRSMYPLERRYGAAVSVFWASPRGPMRWRKPRRDRAL